MTQQEFDTRLTQIEHKYAVMRTGAEAFRDQEVARLFVECGWTQERIGGRMGRTKSWVCKRLVFGRFLKVSGRKLSELGGDSLTEWRFRQAWAATHKGRHPKETEDERFARVARWLASQPPPEVPKGYLNLVHKPGIKAAVVEVLQGGKRLDVAAIADALRDRFPDITNEQAGAAVQGLQKKPPLGLAVEARHSGKSHKYRVVPQGPPVGPPLTPEAAGGLATEALPLVVECIDILRQPEVGRQTTLALVHLSNIQRMLTRLLAEAAVV